ncbi:hypothetical protein PEBR_27407 [Penicillium brasilianum]|uniref:Glycosyltransferase 2 n=1 Tax=Penicillium brasilianum TaxID=104259 RepID=A0A1S9RVK5_PENBI|nr:hypothetical protein PEBR_27407 [Penicillium brasilianum]
MPLRADEELGKKDDDHRIPDPTGFRLLQNSRIHRPRRLIAVLVTLLLLYEFFKHMPTDLTPAAERYNPKIAALKKQNPTPPLASVHSPTPPKVYISQEVEIDHKEQAEQASYDGKIHFYELAQSLPRKQWPATLASEVVLFAAASLHSVSDMLPLACGMAAKRVNHVHFVLMGKEEVSIDGIKQVNGISDHECPITWHDSRPDHAPESTHDRLERSVAGGFEILQGFIVPEVMITQSRDWETSFFWNGVQTHKRASNTPHIALPAPSINLMWMAHIDSTALRGKSLVWNDVHVYLVVHASESSSSLIRLIRSLDAADYLGIEPRLTIELPPWVGADLLESLQNLNGLSQLKGRITLRRRIQPHDMDPVESSLRTVESFYPLDPKVSHLLLLSPQTELAPSFYHYLIYSLLSHKHSAHAQRGASRLLGISLELPSVKPTSEGEAFTPPVQQSADTTQDSKQENIPLFLWQMPNSNAALYFGDKWAEFHSFLSSRLAIPETTVDIASPDKLLSTKYPAFMEYLLEMTRAKGYYMIYPSFPGHTSALLATIHTDLYHPPEEFAHGAHPKLPNVIGGLSAEKPLDRAHTIMPLLDTFELGQPLLESIPLLSYNAERLTEEMSQMQTMDYANDFRTRYGNCSQGEDFVDDPSAHLFCLEV